MAAATAMSAATGSTLAGTGRSTSSCPPVSAICRAKRPWTPNQTARFRITPTIAAVIAHHERTGATILAEGIETDEHLEQALAYGATLGQGYRFGRPGDLLIPPQGSYRPAQTAHPPIPPRASAFDLAARGLMTRAVRKPTLLQLSRHIEHLAAVADSPPIVLAAVQEAKYFTGLTVDVYLGLAERSPLVAVLGGGASARPNDIDRPKRVGGTSV